MDGALNGRRAGAADRGCPGSRRTGRRGREGFLRHLPELPGSLARAEGNQNVETILGRLAEINTVGRQNVETILGRLAEINTVGRFIGSTVVNVEATLIDDDTVERFHRRGMPVGSYTLFPLDTAAVQHVLSEEDEIARALRLAASGVDWFETDHPAKLLDVLRRGAR